MLFVPLLAIIVSTVSAGWIVKDSTDVQCDLAGGNSILTFKYAPADLDIVGTLRAGSCDANSPTADFDVLKDVNTDDNTQTITITYNAHTCSGATFDPADESTFGTDIDIKFESVLKLDIGDLVQQEHTIPVACKLKRQYTVQYDFGALYKKDVPKDNEAVSGIDFEIVAYKTAAREAIDDMEGAKSGKMAYLSLKPKYTLPDTFSYAPTECTFFEDLCTDDTMETCNNENDYKLFENNGDDKTCKQDAPIKFKIDWNKDEKTWLIEYMLFVFTMQEFNKYTLSCDVTLCDKQKFDVAEQSVCNKAARKCVDYDDTMLVDNYAFCYEGGEACFV